MTIYAVTLTLPPNGTIDDQTIKSIDTISGNIEKIIIVFPGGHAGLTNAKIMNRGVQLIPHNLDGYLIGDNKTYEFNPLVEVVGGGVPLVFQGFNRDDFNPHSVFFVLDIQKKSKLSFEGLATKLGI